MQVFICMLYLPHPSPPTMEFKFLSRGYVPYSTDFHTALDNALHIMGVQHLQKLFWLGLGLCKRIVDVIQIRSSICNSMRALQKIALIRQGFL